MGCFKAMRVCPLDNLCRMVIRGLSSQWLVLVVSLSFAASAQVRDNYIDSTISALKRKNYAHALEITGGALKRFPSSPQLWTLRGMALAGQGNRAGALGSYGRALEISPDYLAALQGAAQLYYQARNQKAVPLLEHLLRIHPDDTTAHAMLGSLAFLRDDCQRAIRHFRDSQEQVEAEPSAGLQYGACLARENETQRAMSVFQRLLAVDPNNVQARRGLAATQLKSERAQDALETLSPVLQRGDADLPTMRLAAAAYEANQDTPQAVKILRDAIARDPSNVDLYIDFANIAFTHQSFEAGIKMMNVGLKLQPRSAALYVARGVLYVQLALYDKAEADFDRAQELDPQQGLSAAAQGLMATRENSGDSKRALADLRARLRKTPNDPFLWSLEASLLSENAAEVSSPDFQEAMQAAKKSVALRPTLAPAHDILAKLYLREGKIDQALRECQSALRYDPRDQAALYHLIMVLRRKDRKEEIPELLKRLAQLRQEATQEEAQHNRYKLVIEPEAESNRVGQP